MVLLGVGIGVVVLVLVIIIAVVIIKKKRSPTSNVSKTRDANMPDDYIDFHNHEPPNHPELNRSAEIYNGANSPSTYSGPYQAPDFPFEEDSHYTQVR